MEKSKKKQIIAIIIVSILIVFFLIAIILLENAKRLPISLLEEINIGTDTSIEKEITCKKATLGDKIAYSIDYMNKEPNGGTMRFRNYLSDAGMAVMINGYPNTNCQQMGCVTDEEAYIATQMALWEVMNRTGESHKSIEMFRVENMQISDTVKSAAKKLVTLAENEPYKDVPTLMIDNANVKAHNQGEYTLVGPYVATVTGTQEDTIKSITVNLKNAPESATIVDKDGNAKTNLNNGDTIYVKMKTEQEDTSLNIYFKSEVNRKVAAIYENKNKNIKDYCILYTVPVKMDITLELIWQKN